MTPAAPIGAEAAPVVASGRYRIFVGGRECGEERWRLSASATEVRFLGEQVLVPPHPFPSRQEYRATLTPEWRITQLEIVWTVGERVLHATHAAQDGKWRVRIEAQGQIREQEGDFPDFCEVEYGTPLFNALILARRDFALGGEHDFPVLRIGPPLMAVTPERMLYRCVEVGTFETAVGPVKAKRYEVTLPDHAGEEGYTFWADEEGFLLESYEGIEPTRPWMRLVELRRGS